MKTAMIKLHIAVFLWGFTAVFGKAIELSELPLVLYRLIVVFIAMVVWFIFYRDLQQTTKQQKKQLLWYGFIIATHWLFFYGSIKYANASIALVCLSSTGVIAAILEPMVFKQKLKPTEFLLGFMAIIGIALIFHFETKYRIGIVLGLLAAFFTVLFSIQNKKMVGVVNAKTIMLYEYLGGIIFLVCCLPLYVHFFPFAKLIPTTTDIVLVILLGLVLTILPMMLSLQALQKISAFTLNLTLNLEPVYGIILAFIFYKENKQLNYSFYVGFLLIFLAVVFQMIHIWKGEKRR